MNKPKDYSLNSGERYPHINPELIGGDHLARYGYVIDQYRDSDQPLYGADVFCGSGYGARLMAEALNVNLLAIDGSTETIERATQNILSPNIIFAAKLFPFQLPKTTFDFITSMESIEHVKDCEAFFWTLAASLKPGGRLFISAPNEVNFPRNGYKWHFKHFTRSEMIELARKFGLGHGHAMSTKSYAMEHGKARIFYPYQLNNNQFFDVDVGDTLFFEFTKG